MQMLQEQCVGCPYCGEVLQVLIDHQDIGQEYIEDCQVCCKPIVFSVRVDELGGVIVSVRDENESFFGGA
jgi:hypothetical protein